jgi:hypothetical protein
MPLDRRSALAAAAAVLMPQHRGMAVEAATVRFAVARNGEPIGTHVLDFQTVDDRLEVRIAIAFEVKLLGFTVYRYRHDGWERWRNGQLQAMETTTDDDGSLLSVRAENQGRIVAVEGVDGPHELPADTLPTSYWDRRTVERERWLDTQAGKTIRGRMVPGGTEPVATAAGNVLAERYDMQGGIDLSLWYSGDSWVGLRFAPGDGSSLSYLRISGLPKTR